MTDRPDIWHRLRDHEASPPQGIFERLQQLLETGDAVPVQSSADASSPVRPFERLQQHEVAPPVSLGRQIEARLGVRPPVFSKVRWYLSAAACLVLVVAGWMIYRSYSTREADIAAGKKVQHPAMPKAAVPLPAETLPGKDTSDKLAGAVVTDTSALAGYGKGARPAFSIEGQAIHVADNDLLATFTSFTYPDIPTYLTRNTDKPLKINIDQYTNLYVSKDMLNMMKETYQVLPNGKPARKARKMKRRLDNWKERDQKRFDKGNGANPLDPVDLAEFIFR